MRRWCAYVHNSGTHGLYFEVILFAVLSRRHVAASAETSSTKSTVQQYHSAGKGVGSDSCTFASGLRSLGSLPTLVAQPSARCLLSFPPKSFSLGRIPQSPATARFLFGALPWALCPLSRLFEIPGHVRPSIYVSNVLPGGMCVLATNHCCFGVPSQIVHEHGAGQLTIGTAVCAVDMATSSPPSLEWLTCALNGTIPFLFLESIAGY